MPPSTGLTGNIAVRFPTAREVATPRAVSPVAVRIGRRLRTLVWCLLGMGGTAAGGEGLSAQQSAPSNLSRSATPMSVPQSLEAIRVQNALGKTVPLLTKGEPTIIMISSVSCPWCKRSLKDIGELAAGRPVPRLKLLTIEGAERGGPMLALENITGAQLIGPLAHGDQVLARLQFRGTPTFVAVDGNGRIVATMPGYPMREVLKTWFAVMTGDADVP